LLSSAYRAADIMERFKYINLAGQYELYGNPSLKPERSVFAEYGFDLESGNFDFGLSLFANFINDYIAEKAESATLRRLENIETARILGAELQASALLPHDLKLSGSLSYLWGKDGANDQPLPGIAPWNARITLAYLPANGFRAELKHEHTAPQTRTPAGVAHSKRADITSVTLGYVREGRVTHDVSLSVTNIFDQERANYLANERGYTIWEPGLAASLNYTVKF
ncbi:MAG: TonB-dependent receptor, partial [Deltaproteobacteria bacterium]|nr:TonB-dependent receptor [Deltaproteobacteria bacterium]